MRAIRDEMNGCSSIGRFNRISRTRRRVRHVHPFPHSRGTHISPRVLLYVRIHTPRVRRFLPLDVAAFSAALSSCRLPTAPTISVARRPFPALLALRPADDEHTIALLASIHERNEQSRQAVAAEYKSPWATRYTISRMREYARYQRFLADNFSPSLFLPL